MIYVCQKCGFQLTVEREADVYDLDLTDCDADRDGYHNFERDEIEELLQKFLQLCREHPEWEEEKR